MLKNFAYSILKLGENHLNSHLLKKRYAGHSKWQNIRHIKEAKDSQRAELFTKLSRQMKVAVQEGGSVDPKFNLKLEQVIQQAKRASMPVATIQSILKSCQQDKSQGQAYLLEIKGPGSCFILCEAFTNQLHQLKMGMATILRKHQSRFSDGKITNEDDLLEQATEHAIESGAEDVRIIEDSVQFVCGKTNLGQVVQGLERLSYEVTSASVEYIPLKEQALTDSDLDVCRSLYKKLESLPEVVRISDNIA
ncbi:hypothetical protein NQ318_001929 [Aromia moschata]|uniref:Translational activator of cytochrome c oxidase 1 n=1 Tax=Aromia moschata TaxID=1265417 RepID=A0AAV8Z1J9_9CUCU|nr:hypothetical protein NQ318_001929 [Aromia moschata]